MKPPTKTSKSPAPHEPPLRRVLRQTNVLLAEGQCAAARQHFRNTKYTSLSAFLREKLDEEFTAHGVEVRP
jgi:hypothetical protein